MSKIEWTEKTWNPLAGCTPVSAGCLNCYAATMARRLEAMGQSKYIGTTKTVGGRAVFNGVIRLDYKALDSVNTTRKPTMYFVNSMSDLFHENVPVEFIKRVFDVMKRNPRHTFQVLTKRAARLAELAPSLEWPSNVWMGVSVEDQKAANDRIPHLLRVPAAIRFLSCEPLLGPVDIINQQYDGWDWSYTWPGRTTKPPINWVIAGGESGHHARPMQTEWAQSLREQCEFADIAFFMKQLGGATDKRGKLDDLPVDLRVREMPQPTAGVQTP